MNRIFKVVFNHVLGRHVVVSEVASSIQRGALKAVAVVLTAGAAMAVSGNALADPVTVDTQLSGSENKVDNSDPTQSVFGSHNYVGVVYDADSGTYTTASISTQYGTAFGSGNIVIGDYATAWGTGNTANTASSTAFGGLNSAGEGNVQSNAYIRDWWTADKSGKGSYATAFGNITQAYGQAATAFGQFTVAIGDAGATAFGYGTVAEGNSSTAFGQKTRATGDLSTAFGNSAKASGLNSTAFGSTTTASGQNATAFGSRTKAGEFHSTAFGQYTEARGLTATAWGYGTNANNKVVASGVASTAFGAQTKAGRQLYEGKEAAIQEYIDPNAPSYNPTRYKIVDQNGNTLKDSFQTYNNALSAMTRRDYATAWGYKTDAAGTASTSFGRETTAGGTYSTAFGYLSAATGTVSTAFGNNTKAAATGATAFGSSTVAAGDYSTAFGNGAKAYGSNSLAALGGTTGAGTVTQKTDAQTGAISYEITIDEDNTGTGAVAVGAGATALKEYTYAIGQNAKAEATNTIAIGNNTTVSGENSIAVGNGHTITGKNSGAFGDPTKIEADNSYAIGNSNNITADAGFILGNNATVSAADGIALGSSTQVTAAGGVALGKESVASRTTSKGGYNVLTGEKEYTDGSSTWESTHAAVSVGTEDGSKTRQITGVAAGTEDTDAVNVAQLKLARTEVKGEGSVSVSSSTGEDGHTIYTVSGTDNDTTYTLSGEKGEKAADGSTTYTVSLKDQDGNDAGKAEIVDTDTHNGLTGDTYTVDYKDGIGSVTITDQDGNEATITGIQSGGGIAEISFDGDTGTTVENPETLHVVGGATNADDLTEGNIGVVSDGKDTLTVKLAKDVNLGDSGSVTVGNTKIENNKVTVGDTVVDNSSVTTKTVNATDVKATNVTATNVTATTVKAGNTTINNNGMTIQNGPTITQNNVSMGGQQIHNVAAGTAATDAVNVSQLKQTEANFDQKLNHLNGRIGEVAQDANAGIAMALAAASLPQAYLPGKSMMAIAGGTYRGEQGYAIGFSTVTDDGKWIIKANASGNTQGHYGAAVGAGYMW